METSCDALQGLGIIRFMQFSETLVPLIKNITNMHKFLFQNRISNTKNLLLYLVKKLTSRKSSIIAQTNNSPPCINHLTMDGFFLHNLAILIDVRCCRNGGCKFRQKSTTSHFLDMLLRTQ